MAANLVPLAEATCLVLQRYGDAKLLYITAAFTSHSSQTKPDILFSKKSYSGVTQHYFLELIPTLHVPDYNFFVRATLEHRDFVRLDSEVDLHYATAIAFSLPIEAQVALSHEDITVLPLPPSGKQLADSVICWTDQTKGST